MCNTVVAEFASGLQKCTSKIHDLGELDVETERGEFDRIISYDMN